VVDKLIKGDPTTEHEGDEDFNVDLVHDNDNEEEMDAFRDWPGFTFGILSGRLKQC
jgi:hypothetical protein